MGLTKYTSQFIVFLILLVQWPNAVAFTVVVDPGHGGSDRGATQGAIMEAKIALQVALKLTAKLEATKEIKVILTRADDSSITLRQRVKSNQSNQADLFVSLHGNSSTDRRARGAEFYFGGSSTSTAKTTSRSTLAFIVEDLSHKARLYQSQYFAADSFYAWKESSVSQPRAIKQAPFYVISKNSTPSILIEFGFITNAKESLDLLKDDTQELIAENIVAAIQIYRTKLAVAKETVVK
jgi:N-acetylmuramoyl-L-alanine amidase